MSGGKRKKSFINKIAVVLSTALLTIILTQDYLFTFAPLKELELKLIDARFLKRGKIDITDSSKVIIIEMTQDLFDQIPAPYNKAPFPRFIFAKAIENLTEAGVKAIGIDVVMPDPDKYSSKNDLLMRAAIQKSGKVVVAGKIDEVRESQIQEEKNYSIKNFTDSSYSRIQYNYENIFYDADSSLGVVQVPPDYDMVYRRYSPFRKTGITNKKVPSFGFALVNKYLGLKGTDTAVVSDGFFTLGDKIIPKYDKTSVLINFYGSSRTFPHIKLMDVLDDKEFKTKDEIDFDTDINLWDEMISDSVYQNKFRDKIVIIGSTMPEDRDMLACSFAEGKRKGDNLIYGVEFHANIIQNILSNNYLYTQ
jgi:adenylate cyclase